MSWVRRYRLREHLSTSLWPVSSLFGLAALLVGMSIWRIDQWLGWTLFGFPPKGATALAAAIVGAALTFLGTAFAVLLMVVQFASTQLTPRALRVSLHDPLYRVSLGLFVATFIYAMIMLARTTDTFVPQLGMLLAVILAVVTVIAYVVLISHLRLSLRPVIVAAKTGREGLRTLKRAYPRALGEPELERVAADQKPIAEPTRVVLNPGPGGILVAFDAAGLVAEARRCNARIVLRPAVGDFVRTGAPLFHLFETDRPVDTRRLLDSVAMGQERTMDQDTTFAFRILVDLAIKALSPAINDPTSAVMAIDQLHELLAYLGTRRLDAGEHRDADGRLRLVVEMPRWDDYLSLAIDETRHCGGGQVQIMRRLGALFEDLLALVPADRQAAVRREQHLLTQAVRRDFMDADDQARAREPDAQGIGSSPSPVTGPPRSTRGIAAT